MQQASAEKQVIGTCKISSSANSSQSVCSTLDEGQQQMFALRTYKYVFVLAQLIMGVGGAPLYTLGVTFIDDNVSRKMQPVYSGSFFSIYLPLLHSNQIKFCCFFIRKIKGYSTVGQCWALHSDIWLIQLQLQFELM